MVQQRLHALLLLFSLLQQTEVTADGKYFHILKTCQFIETGSQYDVQYYIHYQYNGRLQAEYNSSTEKVVGFTEYGRQFADTVNKNPDYLKVRRHDLDYYCKFQTALAYKDIQGKAVPPVTRLKSVRSDSSEDSVVLVCSAYNFYPRHIRLSWLRDGVVIPDPPGVVITKMPSGAWRYQIHSHLELTLSTGRNVSCMVEHMGLQEPQLLHFDQSELQSTPLSLPLGGSVLGVGLSFLLCAMGFYWRKTH
ncbi:class II histocompatibility antigen, M beta 1 chain-like [Epinephelus lanceolatus]|uniref:class II histocompatibility antigen, M beta 1 chain-like n=1 Tax=Epinephelus lanceolatus TaxID=310571 RepID=UPI0014486419|nr:class II histocompatibility antigen, M beta 1 chain-like [Epinephelus lanceolatus]